MPLPKILARRLSSLFVMSTIALVASGVLWKSAAAGSDRPSAAKLEKSRIQKASFLQEPRLSLEGGTGWINSGPIRLEELRGKIVLLDFWTYCCINCHHVLPDLARLEQKYKNELVVIGVHTAKFFAERDTENIRQKVREYQIKHPVINDADQVIWNRFGVESWPTLVLIDPEGKYLGSASGEGNFAVLDRAIGQLVARHKAKGDLNLTPLVFFPESEKPDNSPLSYPGKILADEKGRRLFIADTVHNRIVKTDLKGAAPQVIGSGSAGLVDGDYGKAEFNRPQGMCLVGDTLYVADTENHALRAVDLKAKKVSTVAGTGQQSHRNSGGGSGKTTSLNSPWDVVLEHGTESLAIAMAGSHQIWRYDIASGNVSVWAGTGRENILDGPVLHAQFAQPSGLATDGHHLFVADSEVSAIRAITLDRRPAVHTIVGMGLFEFDDRDGVGEEVRLQHALGVAYGNGKLYIADTYNNKIKVCDPKTRAVETLAGSRQPGSTDDPPRFYQPGGLSIAGTNLYVADTNNSAIRVIDLKEGTLRTLELEGLTPPAAKRKPPAFPNAEELDLPEVKVMPGNYVTIAVKLPLPDGFKLNDKAPMSYLVEAPGNEGAIAESEKYGKKIDPPSREFVVRVPLAKPSQVGEKLPLKLSVATFICSKDEKSGLCMVKSLVLAIPIEFAKDGLEQVSISPDPPAPRADANAERSRTPKPKPQP